RLEAQHRWPEAHPRDGEPAQLPFLTRIHAGARIGPCARIARLDLQVGRGVPQRLGEESIAGRDFEDTACAEVAEVADPLRQRGDELARGKQVERAARVQLAEAV